MKANDKDKKLNGRQKAALLLVALGPEVSSEAFKHLSEEEIERLTLEIASVRKVDTEQKLEIIDEFHSMCLAQDYISHGGIEYAKDVLEKALGQEKAIDIISRLTTTLQVRPFDFARKVDPNQILSFIQNEHPQTIALILSYLEPVQSSRILSALPQEVQSDVARRIALMGDNSISPEVISQVESMLEQKLSSTNTQENSNSGGVDAVVQVLNGVDRATERTILEALELQDPELAEEIKKRMFVFEDIVMIDNRGIQRIIREVEQQDLLYALKAASDEVKELILTNMSKRMAETVQEEMEVMGPIKLKTVEESQSRIVAKIRHLEEEGEIVIARGGGDDVVV